MRANPTFMANFSEGNMIDSLKLAEYSGGEQEMIVRKQLVRYTGVGEAENMGAQEKPEMKFEMP
jgi:hypothetical protein